MGRNPPQPDVRNLLKGRPAANAEQGRRSAKRRSLGTFGTARILEHEVAPDCVPPISLRQMGKVANTSQRMLSRLAGDSAAPMQRDEITAASGGESAHHRLAEDPRCENSTPA